MAHFIGYVQGSRGEASRLGARETGIRAQAQGWHCGVKVYGHADESGDLFDIYATGGSSHGSSDIYVGTVRLNSEDRPHLIVAADDRATVI